ncbi:putative Auxin efflux carrier family protein [Melia azedarach]|uniref:Auxin efflux carrier family protein n=1 Tax=Melia azedarach TaxID=155640 RepID=A0ACC1XSV3_MELAZ|nr:putative Auxin efflux carrier family protein [Melia azedarach]
MEIFNLFMTAFIPVLKVHFLTALGLFLALERIDILGAVARKHLNDVSFFVFNPALVGSSLAKNITAKSIGMLWFMPFNVLITFIIGSALGWIVLKITKAPRDLWGLVLGCCSAGNLGNMLFIIIPAVCKEKGSPFGDVDACYNNGMAYSALSMAIGAIYMWSYVYNIVRIYSSNNSGQKQDDFTENVKSVGETTENLSNSSMEPPLPLNGCSAVKVHLNQFEIDRTTSKGKTEVPPLEKIKSVLQTFAAKMDLRKFFAPSTIAAIVGFMVGIVPPFRKMLIGEHAALRVVEDSVSFLGDAAIPTVSLIVGANLLRGLKRSRIHLSLIIGIIMIRYIALPLLGLVVVKGAIRFGLVKSDPLYQFVLLLQFALPPAINIGTMTQLFGAGESECSVIMLWTYALATISLTFWTAFYMWFLK